MRTNNAAPAPAPGRFRSLGLWNPLTGPDREPNCGFCGNPHNGRATLAWDSWTPRTCVLICATCPQPSGTFAETFDAMNAAVPETAPDPAEAAVECAEPDGAGGGKMSVAEFVGGGPLDGRRIRMTRTPEFVVVVDETLTAPDAPLLAEPHNGERAYLLRDDSAEGRATYAWCLRRESEA